MPRPRCLVTLLLILLTGCASVQVSWQQAPQADPGRFSTFAWAENPRRPKTGPTAPDGVAGRLIVESVERQLIAKGYTKAAVGEADFLVVYYASAEEKVDLREPDFQYWRRFEEGVALETRIYREGTLILEIVDAAAEAVVWSGTAVGAVQSVEQVQKDLPGAVEKLLAGFPSHRG